MTKLFSTSLQVAILYLLTTKDISAQGITIASPSTVFTSSTNLIGLFISRALTYAIIAAGLWFFVNLTTSGLSLLISIGEPAKVAVAKDKLLHSLVGFLLVLSSFFIARIVGIIFGINFINP